MRCQRAFCTTNNKTIKFFRIHARVNKPRLTLSCINDCLLSFECWCCKWDMVCIRKYNVFQYERKSCANQSMILNRLGAVCNLTSFHFHPKRKE